uniref:Uncharacterized protein n=1 Tax=Oryza sativa subsp. japonica TaxID=39947 RepID=Q6Z6D5_ORYSJ|nr:hypothetical protein [Oryza sativa Japonica Group]BAD38431.1 hypothetical protein [Oryza sativa Japonica Group]
MHRSARPAACWELDKASRTRELNEAVSKLGSSRRTMAGRDLDEAGLHVGA